MKTEIVPAQRANLDEINAVVEAAKRGLGYDASYLKAALRLMRVTEAYLAENQCFEARLANKVVGFAAVEPLEVGVVLLDHLWIDPGFQRQGIGRRLVTACIAAVSDGVELMRLYADPPSEGFYRRLGCSRVGDKPSRVPGGPVFPIMELAFPSPIRPATAT